MAANDPVLRGLTMRVLLATLASDPVASHSDEIVRPLEAAGLSDETLAEINRLWTIVRAFSNTAHDVNNALQVIAGSAELLEARALEPAVARRVAAIRAQAERAAASIDRLVTYVRAEHRPVEPTDVWPIVDAVVSMRALSAGRQRLRVTAARTTADPCLAIVDGTRLKQALLSVLLAAESSLAGHAGGRIAMEVAPHARGVALTVTVVAEGSPDTSSAPPSPGETLTKGAERWAAEFLVSSMNGRLEIVPAAEGWVAVLIFPSSDGGRV